MEYFPGVRGVPIAGTELLVESLYGLLTLEYTADLTLVGERKSDDYCGVILRQSSLKFYQYGTVTPRDQYLCLEHLIPIDFASSRRNVAVV